MRGFFKRHRLWYVSTSVLMVVTLVFTLWKPNVVTATTQVYTTGSGTWTAPAGVGSVEVECWGGGGAGGAGDTSGSGYAGGGGGGGAYSRVTTFSVTPGNGYSYAVGAGGTGGTGVGPIGATSTFNGTTCVAQGGRGGKVSANGPANNGAGGLASLSTGDVKYNGGTGGVGEDFAACGEGSRGGGGGGGATSTTAGNNGTGQDGGYPCDSTPFAGGTAASGPGGAGGAGGLSGANGSAGSAAGGGGGGGGEKDGGAESGGSGAAGRIEITYTVDSSPPTPNPPHFSSVPAGASSASVSMTSVTVTDTNSVQYYFHLDEFAISSLCNNGDDLGTGFTSSGWQSSASYTDTGLDTNKCYHYTITARDNLGNYTSTSTASSTYTFADVPGTMNYKSVTVSSFQFNVWTDFNPAINPVTYFLVYASTTDTNVHGKYMADDGSFSSTPVWLSRAQIMDTTVSNLQPSTLYGLRFVARNENLILTATSSAYGTTTLADTTDPTPNPHFSTVPGNDSASAVSMTSVTVTDDYSSPVNYFFDSVAGSCGANVGTGGTDSGWQSSTSYTDSGLDTNKCYAYQVTAKDNSNNVTATSSASSTYTSAAIPGTISFSSVSNSTFVVTNNANGNPSGSPTTTFAVQVSSSSPIDTTWDLKYVDASGDPSASAVWLTDAQIDGLTVRGLNESTQYTLQVKARNEDSDETSFSSTAATTTTASADTTAPTPDPMTFATAPDDLTTTSIDMIATTASDPSTPIEYYFTAGAGSCGANQGTGGTDSGWQSSTSYTDSGLQINRCYAYTVTARDAVPNSTAASTATSVYTSANVPGLLSQVANTTTTMTISNAENSNPSSNPTTSFAILVNATSPADASWQGKFVDASGNPSASAVWLTDAQIENLVVQGLTASTDYTFLVKARNGDSEQTTYSASSTLSTADPSPLNTTILQGVRLEGVRVQ